MAKTTEIVLTKKQYLADFSAALASVAEAGLEAARIYVEAIDSGVVTRKDFRELSPNIANAFLNDVESLGRGLMDPRLLTASGGAANRVRRLPTKSQQTEVLDKGVEVLTKDGSMLTVKCENLTTDQVRQVFAGDHVRDAAGQKAYIESQAVYSRELKTVQSSAFETRGATLIVHEPMRFSRQDLARIVAEMG